VKILPFDTKVRHSRLIPHTTLHITIVGRLPHSCMMKIEPKLAGISIRPEKKKLRKGSQLSAAELSVRP